MTERDEVERLIEYLSAAFVNQTRAKQVRTLLTERDEANARAFAAEAAAYRKAMGIAAEWEETAEKRDMGTDGLFVTAKIFCDIRALIHPDAEKALDEVKAQVRDECWGAGGVAAIASERQRQIDVEGWTPEHDDTHIRGELSAAAACYAVPSRDRLFALDQFWPPTWSYSWWKPVGAHDDIAARRRDLVRAGALIAADDRLDRTAIREKDEANE